MSPAQFALRQAEARLLGRLGELAGRLDAGDEGAWPAYCEAASTLAAIAEETTPGAHGRLMTTRELADSLGVSPKTILRRRKAGQVEAVQLGSRGRAALRWPREAAGR